MNHRLTARPPMQDRSRQRVSIILQEAENLLESEGLAGFSIPTLAENLGYPRATIYKFFPTPTSILNSLVERHLEALVFAIQKQTKALSEVNDWHHVTRLTVETAANYYREHRVACILLLGGPVSDESYRSQELTINLLGELTHNMLQRAHINLADNPCEAALAIEYGTASFRLSYFFHQTITPEYIEAAGDVMIAFIESRLKR